TASGANGGGAVFVNGAGGPITIRNTTITANAATAGKGGGFSFTSAPGASSAFESSIIAGNSASVSNRDFFSTPTFTINGSQNLFGQVDTAVTPLADTVNNQYGTDVSPVDAGLFPLSSYKIGAN